MSLRRAHVVPLAILAAVSCSEVQYVVVESGGGGTSATATSAVGSGGAGGTVEPSGTGGPGSASQTSGASQASGASGGGGDVVACPSYADPCLGCVATLCPEVWCDCQGNADCLLLFQCFGGCKDDACGQACMTEHADAIAAVLAVSGCAGTTCDGACSWGAANHTPCAGCVYETCAAETNACFGKPSCFALWKCLDACDESALSCHKACYDLHPDGVASLETLFSCTSTGCAAACP